MPRKLLIALFIIFLLLVVDIVLKLTLGSRTLFRGLPGTQVLTSGKLERPLDLTFTRFDLHGHSVGPEVANAMLTFNSDSQELSMHFLEVKGRLWRGEMTIGPGIFPGYYSFTILPKSGKMPERPTEYSLWVFADEEALRKSSASITEKLVGIAPWWVALGIIPLIVAAGVLRFRQASIEEARLQAAGIGEIYRLARRKKSNSWEVMFGLGARHGLNPGDVLNLLDSQKKCVGKIVAETVKTEYFITHVDGDMEIRPSYYAQRIDHG